MKFKKYIQICLLLLTGCIVACQKQDNVVFSADNENVSMTAEIFGNTSTTWAAEFSARKDTIYFNVPYYLSTTATAVTDLSKMQLRATLPRGATITPALAGIKDLTSPIQVSIMANNGEKRDYVIAVKLVKSSLKVISGFSISSLNLKGSLKSDGNMALFVPSTFDESKLVNVVPTFILSPWATVSPAMNIPQDFTKEVTYVVTAHDGTKQTYKVIKTLPKRIDYGFGYSSLLWKQGAKNLGFTASFQTTMAVQGNKLIVASRTSPFLIIDVNTGEKLPEVVNISGTEVGGVGGIVFGITNDKKENLLAVNFTRINNVGDVLKVFRWKNGLNSPPTAIIELPVYNFFKNEVNRSIDVGRTITVYGDLDGDAQIFITMSNGNGSATVSENRAIAFEVKNGVVTNATNPALIGAPGFQWGYFGRMVPTSATTNSTYYALSLAETKQLAYINNGQVSMFNTAPSTSRFWDKNIINIHYFEFNNAKYLATLNANRAGLNELLTFDVTNPALVTINTANASYNQTFCVLGSSPITLNKTEGTHVGDNGNGTGGIAVKFSADGNSAIIFTMVTDLGIMAHEVNNYELAN